MAQQSIAISQYFLDSLTTILCLSHMLGLMPFKYFKKECNKLILRFSYALAAYGLLWALFLTLITCVGFNADMADSRSTYLNKPLNKYLAGMEVVTLLICEWTIHGSFIINRVAVLEFAYYLTLVDQTLQLQNASGARKRARATVALLAALAIVMSVYIHLLRIFVLHDSFSMLMYSAGYLTGHIMMLIPISLYWILCDCAAQRVVILCGRMDAQRKRGVRLTNQDVTDMIFVYENIHLAMMSFSSVFGPIILAELVNILIGSITSLYAIVDKTERSDMMARRFMELAWVIYHTICLLLIIEPVHRLNEKLARVRRLLSELLSLDVDSEVKTQMEIFTANALLSETGSFSPIGMFNLNRNVVITVIATIATYVVLIMNVHDG